MPAYTVAEATAELAIVKATITAHITGGVQEHSIRNGDGSATTITRMGLKELEAHRDFLQNIIDSDAGNALGFAVYL